MITGRFRKEVTFIFAMLHFVWIPCFHFFELYLKVGWLAEALMMSVENAEKV
jgi:hypothetical protein